MTVPGVGDAAGGPPGGGALPPVTSSMLRVQGGNQGNSIAESINSRSQSSGKPHIRRSVASPRGGVPDGDYTLEDLQRLDGDVPEGDGWDPKEGLKESVIVNSPTDPDGGAKLASRVLGRMMQAGR